MRTLDIFDHKSYSKKLAQAPRKLYIVSNTLNFKANVSLKPTKCSVYCIFIYKKNLILFLAILLSLEVIVKMPQNFLLTFLGFAAKLLKQIENSFAAHYEKCKYTLSHFYPIYSSKFILPSVFYGLIFLNRYRVQVNDYYYCYHN